MLHRAALLSVSDQTGLKELAEALLEHGYTLLTTSGTGKFLASHDIESTPIEEYTGQKEILDGRVKTLHPKIHAGLLARRDRDDHMLQLKEDDIFAIEFAVVNLYPFVAALRGEHANNPDRMIEYIDIGGPTMIRAAAKNFRGVVPLIDPADYPDVIAALRQASPNAAPAECISMAVRQRLAAKVFARLADYNLQIARYMAGCSYEEEPPRPPSADEPFREVAGVVLERAQSLRYGENPHQRAAYYRAPETGTAPWRQIQGKELSYNNLLDFDAAFKLIRSFQKARPSAVILKHLNPCGAAKGDTLVEALQRAKQSDPRSHFGGILAFNREVDRVTAEGVAEDFAEIVVAPGFHRDALEVFARKKNLRVLTIDFERADDVEYRSVQGGFLVQEPDRSVCEVTECETVSARSATAEELRDLQFAWTLCAHLKSNAICIVSQEMLLAAGAGQMSRIDSVEVALHKAQVHGHPLQGAVAASDAFFPFPDCIEVLAQAGVRAVIAPRGAKRDQESVEVADRLKVALLFTGERHFRH